MKESLHFNSLQELHEKSPENKRPNNIFINGESIFERPKTPAQKEIIKTAFTLVGDHFKKLGIAQKSFDENRIAFLPQKLALTSGEYHDGDFFTVDESAEANLGIIVHELIHAQSSEWRNYDEPLLEEFLEKNNLSVKSGFHRHSRFKTINEGITEKIAREIIHDNPDAYTKLKPLFEGRMEEMVANEEKIFQEETLPQKIKEKEARLAETEKKIQEYSIRFTEDQKKIDEEIEHTDIQSYKDALIIFKKEQYESYLKDIEYLRDMDTLFDSVQFNTEKHAINIEAIKDNYNFSPDTMTSYTFNITLVDKLVEGIALFNKRNNNNLDIEEEKQNVWKELQKAYFQGTTVYLRKIDQVFGEGFLRKIDSLSQMLTKDQEQDFLNELESKITRDE